MSKFVDSNFYFKAGIDEVGRGALAGNVIAAAVILHPNKIITGLTDSKKISSRKRFMLSLEIQENSLAWSYGYANAREIDLLNILQASVLAMQRAVLNLKIKPNFILVDGKIRLDIKIPYMSIIKGDNLISEISAASILAKVYRDTEMYKLSRKLPQYGFEKHKGYPTQHHLEMLKKYGITKYHRYSFSSVYNILRR
ncbi:ribonuclease HII [Buchnera aphidicola (Hormaphis cornu)]|nr:ribonuclease HII [Buchnera aphidicola (Hormaphis cornu)]